MVKNMVLMPISFFFYHLTDVRCYHWGKVEKRHLETLVSFWQLLKLFQERVSRIFMEKGMHL